ncbi:hypothetical protein V1515DRAFT_616432 [Lipomyces mesembrius]
MESSSPTLPEEDLYQRALDFLAANEPEQCLQVQLPFDKYEEVERHAQSLYGEKNTTGAYPYVDCPNKSMAIIYTAPSPLHGMFSASFQSELYHVAKHLEHPPIDQFSEDINSRILKVTDGGVIYTLNNEDVLTVVIETGLSEKYDNLQNDAKLWLDEQPKFKYPKKTAHNTSLEIYNVAKNWLVRDGAFLVQDDQLDIGITFGDIVPRDEPAVVDIRIMSVKFVTEDIRELLISGARRTASVRFRALIRDE